MRERRKRQDGNVAENLPRNSSKATVLESPKHPRFYRSVRRQNSCAFDSGSGYTSGIACQYTKARQPTYTPSQFRDTFIGIRYRHSLYTEIARSYQIANHRALHPCRGFGSFSYCESAGAVVIIKINYGGIQNKSTTCFRYSLP